MYAMYALYATFATPIGHTGCDSYKTRHLHKMMAAGRLPWESDDEVLLLYAVGNKRKRKWVHEVNMKRRESGEFLHLKKQLRQDEVKFKEYFRMSSDQFEQLLSLIFHFSRNTIPGVIPYVPIAVFFF